MVKEFSGQSGESAELILRGEHLFFSTRIGKKHVMLRGDKWSPWRIPLSKEGAEKASEGGLFFSISFSDAHYPWNRLEGEVRGNTFYPSEVNNFLKKLYECNADGIKTIGAIPGSLGEIPQQQKRIAGLVRLVLSILLVSSIVILGLDYWEFFNTNKEDMRTSRTQILDRDKTIDSHRLDTAVLSEKIATGEKLLPTLREKLRVTTERVKKLKSAAPGTVVDGAILTAEELNLAAREELDAKEGEIQENIKKQEEAKKQKVEFQSLEAKYETLRQDNYWKYLRRRFPWLKWP